jgi:hypothetical protein
VAAAKVPIVQRASRVKTVTALRVRRAAILSSVLLVHRVAIRHARRALLPVVPTAAARQWPSVLVT